MIFIHLSDDPFVIAEFEYLFTVFVYDFSVLSRDLIFVNNRYFPDLFFLLFCSNYRDLGDCCFHG